MQYTIFDTPGVRTFVRWLAVALLRLSGWRIEGKRPDFPKYVVVVAPHTSNWELPIALAIGFALRIKAFWMGKHTLFRGPFRAVFTWMGGIPIERTASHGVVEQSIQRFRDNDELVMVLAPEGTRTKVAHWKTGFYHIAKGAGVPIVLAFLDYRRKVGGIGPVIVPTGDIEADMRTIHAFYAAVSGKHPEKSSLATFMPGA